MISPLFKSAVEQSLSEKLKSGVVIRSLTPIGGGCINDAQRMDTSAGRFFIKWNDAKKYPGMFEAEAKGLSLLHAVGVVAIPTVILTGEMEGKSYIVLDYVEAGRKRKDFWEDFGTKLAMLHQHVGASFGLDHDNYIGSLHQCNRQHPSWIEFFINERIEPLVELAKNSGALSNPEISKFSNLYKRLSDLIPEEKPALLHGDLWNSNFMIAPNGSACLIDPAVYYGHREMDLAMTHLFGCFDEQFYAYYEDTFALAPGFEERIDIHNLYPLLVHVNLFGGGFVAQVKTILSGFE